MTPPTFLLAPKRTRTEAFGLPPQRLQFRGEKAGHFTAGYDFRLFGERDVDGAGVGRRVDGKIRFGAGARIGRLGVFVAYVVAMHMADQQRVDITEARVGCAGDRPSGVIQKARAVRVFENQRPVEFAKFPVLLAKRCDFDVGGEAGRDRQANETCSERGGRE